MTMDRLFGILSIVGLGAFFSVVFVKVNALPLRIVLALALLAAAYDFWRSLRKRSAD
jgi:hypothetical protein